MAMIPNGAAYEQHELSSTDKEMLDKKIGAAKRAGWIVRGIRHSSDGMHMATLVRGGWRPLRHCAGHGGTDTFDGTRALG
jgi:hypothetical protein